MSPVLGSPGVVGPVTLPTTFGGVSGFGKPNPPPGGGGRKSAAPPGTRGCCSPPVLTGPSRPPTGDEASGPVVCANAGIIRLLSARTRKERVGPRHRCQNTRPIRELRGFIRARHIARTALRIIIIIIIVGAEMLARHRVALVEEKTDSRASAEHAQAALDLHLLRVMGLYDEHDLSNQRRKGGSVAARHTWGRVDDDVAITKAVRHFGHQHGHLIAGEQLGYLRAALAGREN